MLKDIEVYFRFLDILRESGINMFGAAPPLMEMFNLEKAEAKTILIMWMETFNERKSKE